MLIKPFPHAQTVHIIPSDGCSWYIGMGFVVLRYADRLAVFRLICGSQQSKVVS